MVSQLDLASPAFPLGGAPMGFHGSDSDPDTSPAYFGKKISLLLGEAQKAFEGGASNEKLGSMVGGYGSFLPIREHDPLILHQDRNPPNSEAAPAEAAAENGSVAAASCVSTRVSGSKSGVEATKESANRDATRAKENALDNADNSSASNDYKNGCPPQKKVMLRIKIGPDSDMRKKNDTVYRDFGLSNSSSVLDDDDNDEDEDQVSDFDADSSPEKSPHSMIRRMTLDHIPGGRLLSPFIPDITRENSVQKEQVWSGNTESLNLTTVDVANESSLVKDGRKKLEKPKEKTSSKSKNGSKNESKWGKQSLTDSDKHARSSNTPSKHAVNRKEEKSVDDIVFGKDVKKASCNGSRSDREPLESFSHEVDHVQKRLSDPQSNACQSEKAMVSSFQVSMQLPDDTYQRSREEIKETAVSEMRMQKKRPPKVSADSSQGKKRSSIKRDNDLCEGKAIVSHQDMKEISKFKNVGTSCEPTGNISKNVIDGRRHSMDSLKETNHSQAISKDKERGHLKEARKSFPKDKSSKEALVSDVPKDSELRKSQDSSSKSFNKEPQQRFPVKLRKPEASELQREEKPKEKMKPVSLKKDASKSYESRLHESASVDQTNKSEQPSLLIPATNASEVGNLDPAAGSLPAVRVFIENWVCCDKCERWRLLPPGVESDNLPKKWVCKMLDWLQQGMNSCKIPEEITSDATRVLYHNAMHQPEYVPAVVSSATIDDNQATRAADSSRVTINKKRKSSASALEEISNKGTDARQAFQDDGHLKLAARTSNETNQVKKLKSLDSSSQAGEEHSAKKREKGAEKIGMKEQKREKLKEVEKGKEKNNSEKEKVKLIERERQVPESRNSAASNDYVIPAVEDRIEQSTVDLLIRDAMNLKRQAESLISQKSSDNQGTALYLQAALKFLEAASILELQGGEQNENLQINIYGDTAKLCKFCADEYERRKDLAAAALAYKCASLAHMRVIQAKTPVISKDRAEILMVSQQAATGNSGVQPHSAMDNLQAPSVSNTVHIPKRNQASLHRILQYVENTTAAMEAVTKSNTSFSAYAASTSNEGVSAVKKVLDFGIHDVKSFITLIQLALKAIGHSCSNKY